MTKLELFDKIIWDEYNMGGCNLFIELFQKEIPFIFFVAMPPPPPNLSDKMFDVVKDVLNLPLSTLEKIKSLLWEECLFAFEVADYGVDREENETHVQAHLRAFNLKDKEAAYHQSNIAEVHIHHQNDPFKGRYAEIKVNSSSDNYISLIIKDGNVIDFDDDGTHLQVFDEDTKYAHRMRQKVLNT